MGNNVNIEGVIPLEGPGFVNKALGRFQPGEFKRCVNMEINTEGVLSPRPGLLNVIGTGFSSVQRFMGYVGNVPFLKTNTSQWAVANAGIEFPMTGSTSTVTHPNILSNTFVACFLYNNFVYWISIADFNAAGTYSRQVMVHKSILEFSSISTQATTYAGYTHHVVSTVSTNTVGTASLQGVFCNSFIQKDRLWILLDTGIWFSKSTDPTIWPKPDGGFFKAPGYKFNHAVFIGDSIYISSNKAIHMLSYSSDPNTDSQFRVVVDALNVFELTVYRDTVLFVDNDVLYSLQNSYVQKLRDLNLNIGKKGGTQSEYTVQTRLTVYNSYLILSFLRSTGNTPASSCLNFNQGLSLSALYTSYAFHYFLNMDSGFMWEFDFHDVMPNDGIANKSVGVVTQFGVNPESTRLELFTRCLDGVGVTTSYVYYMSDTDNYNFSNEIESYDRVSVPNVGGSGGSKQTIHYNVEISSYTPDGTESKIKKFRSLVLEGRLPEVDDPSSPKISFSFGDSSSFTSGIPLLDSTESYRPPVAYRYPINQRARELTLRISSQIIYGLDSWIPPNDKPNDAAILSLSRLSVFWSYLQRLPTKRNSSSDV